MKNKFVPRDVSTSLITYSNASNFAISPICEINCDTHFAKSSDDEAEEEAIRKQNNIAYQRSEVDRAP